MLSTCSSSTSVPCADFLATTFDGRVQTIPLTAATLHSRMSISGAFDRAEAQALAADYTAASVQLQPR